jgi:hypothetical protein
MLFPPVPLSRVSPGILKKGSELIQVIVSVAPPHFVGTGRRVVHVGHDGTRGVVDIDEDRGHAVGRADFFEEEG